MTVPNLLRLTNAFLFVLCLTSCSPKVSYSVVPSDKIELRKLSFGQNKDVITFDGSRYKNGAFFLFHDFSFDKRLVIDMREVKVLYRGGMLPFSLFGENYKKETFEIDGDDNLTTYFGIRLPLHVGDTLTVKFDNFLHDKDGKEYKLDPINLIVIPYVKTR